MRPIEVMLDLKTFGTKPYSTFISLGAVWFDPSNEQNPIRSEFYVTIDPINATKRGLRMDADTICWWLAPEQHEAYLDWYNTVHFELDTALDGFSMWIAECLKSTEPPEDPANPKRETYAPADFVHLWGNGASFDCTLLGQGYEVIGHEKPWHYFNERCFRTLKSLPGASRRRPVLTGVKHNPLIDARHQALWASYILQDLILQAPAVRPE